MLAFFQFILFLIAIIFFVAFFIVVVFVAKVKSFFAPKRQYRDDTNNYANTNYQQPTQKKKIISPDEGEYIDYEEVED